jgi:phospholipid/cholesterol/gamma-HCH transport system ATP-binding protein
LHLLKIEHVASLYPSELSGGMKKRVAIGRALMMRPQIMLYDEPTSELDPQTAAMIAEIIGTLRNSIGVTSLIVSHDVAMAMAIADRIGILMDGVLKIIGTPQVLSTCEDPLIKDFLYPQISLQNPRFYQK